MTLRLVKFNPKNAEKQRYTIVIHLGIPNGEEEIKSKLLAGERDIYGRWFH
jgi:hypothetical protein